MIIRKEIKMTVEGLLKPGNLWLRRLPMPELMRIEVSTVATA
jgi:hypothetical protein